MDDELLQRLSPLLASSGIDLVDLDLSGRTLTVTVDRDGGIDFDGLTLANQVISGVLDDLDPIDGHYTLEVTSPGLERRLRLPVHFHRALGDTVSIRLRGDAACLAQVPGGARRLQGDLVAADDHAVSVRLADSPADAALLEIAYGDIDRARTVFQWGAAPAPSPSKGRPKGAKTGTDRPARPQASPGGSPGATIAATHDVTTHTERVTTP